MAGQHPSSGDASPTGSLVSDRLDSWKAISAFLRRDVRTVQRWEANEGLPVYRQRGLQRGPIFAYKSEIESWWKARQSKLRQRRQNVANVQETWRDWLKLSYVRMAILAALILALALLLFKAKQMFLSPRTTSSTALLTHPITLAVLPFQSSSSTSEDNNIAMNITEELINDCRHSKTVRVDDQSRIMAFLGGVDNSQHTAQLPPSDKLLRGTAGRSGKSIRVTAQLIDPATGNPIWSRQFESDDEDFLESERQIAGLITREVETTLAFKPHAGVGRLE